MRIAGHCEDYAPPTFRAVETSKTYSRRLQRRYGRHCRVFEVMPVNGPGFTASHTTSHTHTPRSAWWQSQSELQMDELPDHRMVPEDPRRAVLLETLQQLDSIDRQVVLLYLEGLSAGEIEQVTGLSANSIGVRLSRLRRRLALMVMSKEVRE